MGPKAAHPSEQGLKPEAKATLSSFKLFLLGTFHCYDKNLTQKVGTEKWGCCCDFTCMWFTACGSGLWEEFGKVWRNGLEKA
jgi:GH24 family phage-related lysozyme (muramidase)